MRPLHLTVALTALLLAAPAARPQPAPAPGTPMEAESASFTVFVRSVPVGTVQTTITADASGWTIDSTGRLGAPLDILLRRMVIRYDATWHPKELMLLATVHGQAVSQETTFANGTATVREGGTGAPATEAVPADAIILPNPFFGAYEALAERLVSAAPGSTLHIYAAPHIQYDAHVGPSSTEELQTAERRISARLTPVTFLPANQPPVATTILADASGRLLRFDSPQQSLQVVREDIASVSTRRLLISRPNDRDVNIPANGFSLAGTLSTPMAAAGHPAPAGKLPAVILVGPPAQSDRDAVTAGIPVFGQLAGALADAGFAVLRYDNRGTGQSGGRPDAATLEDYASDARAAVKYMAGLKDVDHDRIAMLGDGEGGDIAMLAAAKEKKIAALILVGTASTTGAAALLERQEHLLGLMTLPAAEKEKRIAMQKKIQKAVVSGKGWEGISPVVRQQSDTPLFKSLLTFDPAKVMAHVEQPILIVQGALDREVPAADAARLEQLAKARKHGGAAVGLIEVPGVNHLLVPATTGEVDEYPQLPDKHVSGVATSGIAAWLRKTFAARH